MVLSFEKDLQFVNMMFVGLQLVSSCEGWKESCLESEDCNSVGGWWTEVISRYLRCVLVCILCISTLFCLFGLNLLCSYSVSQGWNPMFANKKLMLCFSSSIKYQWHWDKFMFSKQTLKQNLMYIYEYWFTNRSRHEPIYLLQITQLIIGKARSVTYIPSSWTVLPGHHAIISFFEFKEKGAEGEHALKDIKCLV